LLVNSFLLTLVDPWARVRTRRTAIRPKVHVLDSGVAASFLAMTTEKAMSRDPAARSWPSRSRPPRPSQTPISRACAACAKPSATHSAPTCC
jgi:hypothetical protein